MSTFADTYNHDQLFLWDYEDLEEACAEPSERKLVSASGTLRRMLCDSISLAPTIQQAWSAPPFRFSVTELAYATGPDPVLRQMLGGTIPFHSVNEAIVPGLYPSEVRVLTLDQFLASYSMTAMDESFTAKETIRMVAHVIGGVHIGKPKTPQEKAMEQLVRVYGFGDPIRPILGITQVTVAALKPLRDIVAAGLSKGPNVG